MPTAEGSGTIVLTAAASSSKDEMMIGGLYVIDGIDGEAPLVPEEDAWQLEAAETCTIEPQLRDREQESIAVVNFEDPSTSETIEAFDARTGERLDLEEVRKGRAREARELDEFDVKMEVDESEMRVTLGKNLVKVGGNAKGSKQPACTVNTGEPRSGTSAATPSLKFVRLILSWAASYMPKRANASRIIAVFDISVAFFQGEVRKVIFVVPPEDLRKKGKIWRLLKSLFGTRDASQVFATHVEEGLNEHGIQRNAMVPCLYWSAVLEALGVHWKDDHIFGILDGRANDLEQLMREVFKVKICEHVGPGFL